MLTRKRTIPEPYQPGIVQKNLVESHDRLMSRDWPIQAVFIEPGH